MAGRKKRSDSGSKRPDYTRLVTTRKSGVARGPYKARDIETRGEYPKEARIFRSFWSKHKMIDIEFLNPEELDIVIDKFFEEYEATQIKTNSRWWYPDSPMDRVIDLRYRK